MALGADERGDRADHGGVVIDDEDPERAAGQAISSSHSALDGDRGGKRDDEAGPVGSAGSHQRRAPIDLPRRLAAYSPMPDPRAVWVSRRAYGSKIRSRHSSGMPGPSSVTPMVDEALDERPIDRDRRVRRGVLDRVLDEVLEDLAETRRVGEGVESRHAGRSAGAGGASGRASSSDLARSTARHRPARPRPRPRHDPDRGQDRVDEAVQPLDLLERRVVPGGSRLRARSRSRDSRPSSGGSSASRSA